MYEVAVMSVSLLITLRISEEMSQNSVLGFGLTHLKNSYHAWGKPKMLHYSALLGTAKSKLLMQVTA